jgi:NTP pyrophosphatase (non-canonical NTP hydrolase)
MSINSIALSLEQFAKDRDWDQFHTPTNLAKSISIESAELLELFQWTDKADIAKVRQEIADIAIYLIMLCNKTGTDLETEIVHKISANEKKYPASLVRGSSKKYTEYEGSKND